jgi:hypothetical protein
VLSFNKKECANVVTSGSKSIKAVIMNSRILLTLIAAVIFSSCSTMYKSGQTPDDVYYSPGQERGGYVTTDDDRNDNGYDNHTDVSSRYLRMKSINRNRWSSFDDDLNYWNDYRWNNPYMMNSWYSRPGLGFGYNNWGMGGIGMGYGHMGYNNFWGYNNMFYNNPWAWNNPFGNYYYGTPVIILNPKPVYRNPMANGPRAYNLNTYTSTNRKGYYNEEGGRRFNNAYSGSNAPVRVFNNNPSQGGSTNPGRGGRYINTNSSSGNRGGYNPRSSGSSDSRSSSPTRSFDRGSNNSGGSTPARSSGGSSGGSAPVRSFPRGGR